MPLLRLVLAGVMVTGAAGCGMFTDSRTGTVVPNLPADDTTQAQNGTQYGAQNETRHETQGQTSTSTPTPSSGRDTAAAQTANSGNTPAVTIDDTRSGSQSTPAPRPEPTRGSPRTRAEAALESGKDLRSTGDSVAALAEFERAIAINPSLVAAYVEAAELYREQGEYRLAEERARRAADLEPDNFRAQSILAGVLQLQGRHAEAVRTYLRALAIRPDDPEANLGLGTAYLELGEPSQSLPYLQVAVRRQPDSGEGRLNLGAAYAGLDRHEEAIIEYQQAAELLPTIDPELLLSLADSLGRVERYAEMVATLDELLRSEPSAIGYERLGSGLFRMKRYDAALDAFQESARLDSSHYPAHNGVAVCKLNTYLWSGRTDRAALADAIAALRESLRLRADQPRIIELLRRYGKGGG